MKKTYYIFLAFLIICVACDREEWLNIQPQGTVIPTDVKDYRLLLDQVDQNGQGRGIRISPGFQAAYSNTDYVSDDFVITDETFPFYGVTIINAYTWQDEVLEPNQEDGNWATLYGQIYVANLVIEEVMDAQNGTQSEKLQLLAEAKVHRAFCYFALANLYGLHYNPETAASNPAVPLRLGTEIEGVDFARASVAEVYDLILEDINSSIANLPDTPESGILNHRPTKSSTYALLSRIYLYQAAYQKALEAASNSLALTNMINDLNAYDEGFGGLLRLDEPENDQQLLWNKASSPFSLLIASDELYNLYEDNDLRKKLYGPLNVLFGIPQPGNVLGYSFLTNYRGVGFTVPEVLLTKAECNARLGNITEAVQDLNILREKRFETGTYTPIVNSNQAEVLALVKKERRMELAGNGLRFFDLKRYNEFDNANLTLTRILNGETHTLTANGKNWALPIARKYIEDTPELGENIRD